VVASTGRVGGQGDGATGSKQPEDADDFLAGKGLARRAVAAIAMRRQPQMQPNPTGRRSWKGDPNSKDLPLTSVDAIRSDFAFLDDWEDRYRYVLELGRTLEPLSEAAHNGANKVRGCVSQVWLELGDGANAAGERVLHYRGDSDSHLVRGLIAIALALYSDRTVREILSSDARRSSANWVLSNISRRNGPMGCGR
jgi:cysteine desulfuration protein SufE